MKRPARGLSDHVQPFTFDGIAAIRDRECTALDHCAPRRLHSIFERFGLDKNMLDFRMLDTDAGFQAIDRYGRIA
ncbi:MAG: hypothetical protein ACR2FI_05725, partial [Burkholderiales bacterium]